MLVAVLDTATERGEGARREPGPATTRSAPHAIRRTLDGCAQALERIAAIPVDVRSTRRGPRWSLRVDELSVVGATCRSHPHMRGTMRCATPATALRSRGSANLERARSPLGR